VLPSPVHHFSTGPAGSFTTPSRPLPAMGHAAQTDVPPSVLNVYQPWELVLLALSGLVIAVVGALIPAGWAARTRTASALRAEYGPYLAAQRIQVTAAGRAASRSSPIGCPHRSHNPYRPSRTRSSAASIAAT
jgi:hypothetical protein